MAASPDTPLRFPTMTRTIESFARVARWPYAGLPPKSANSLITSSMSARDPSGLPNGPTGSGRRRLPPICAPGRLPAISPSLDRSPPQVKDQRGGQSAGTAGQPRSRARMSLPVFCPEKSISSVAGKSATVPCTMCSRETSLPSRSHWASSAMACGNRSA
jgi:hypothetical protein